MSSSLYNPSRFEYPYGIGLLDDLHNILPEILYDTQMFRGDTHQLLQSRVEALFPREYAQKRTQYRFFQLEHRRREAGIAPAPPLPVTPPRRVPRTRVAPIPPATPRRPVRAAAEVTTHEINIPLNNLGSLFDSTMLMNTLLGGLGPTVAGWGGEAIPRNLSPVPVRPTSDQVSAASIVTSLVPAGTECPICQDDQAVGGEWRILRYCQHRFHRSCIDTWFQQNVRCPVCRHDIREGEDDHEREVEGESHDGDTASTASV